MSNPVNTATKRIHHNSGKRPLQLPSPLPPRHRSTTHSHVPQSSALRFEQLCEERHQQPRLVGRNNRRQRRGARPARVRLTEPALSAHSAAAHMLETVHMEYSNDDNMERGRAKQLATGHSVTTSRQQPRPDDAVTSARRPRAGACYPAQTITVLYLTTPTHVPVDGRTDSGHDWGQRRADGVGRLSGRVRKGRQVIQQWRQRIRPCWLPRKAGDRRVQPTAEVRKQGRKGRRHVHDHLRLRVGDHLGGPSKTQRRKP